MELTLSQEFELTKLQEQLKDCDDLDKLKDMIVQLKKQMFVTNNFWVSQIKL